MLKTVSSHHDCDIINKIGSGLSDVYKNNFIVSDEN